MHMISLPEGDAFRLPNAKTICRDIQRVSAATNFTDDLLPINTVNFVHNPASQDDRAAICIKRVNTAKCMPVGYMKICIVQAL